MDVAWKGGVVFDDVGSAVVGVKGGSCCDAVGLCIDDICVCVNACEG